jgi:3-oxoacyl-[acyl-carrier protein] reductase
MRNKYTNLRGEAVLRQPAIRFETTRRSRERYGKPSEIAGAVAFLAGSQARFINGPGIAFDGIALDGGHTPFPG